MKKLFSFIFSLGICCLSGLAFTACDFLTTDSSSSSNSGHEHVFETVWSKNETYHWYACKGTDCEEVSNKGEHTFENNVCTVCLYEKTVVPSINEVTAEQFAAALSFESVTNVTIVYESNDEGSVYGYTTYFDGNKIKAVYDDSFEDVVDTIYEVDSQKLYGYWYMEENDGYAYTGWVKVSINLDDEMANATISGIESIRQMLMQINYSDCIYEDNVYAITQTIDEVSTNFAFQFENGVLKSVRLSSIEGGTEYYSLFTFSDCGTTTVTLPAEYKELSEITPTPSSNWANYFNFDNVTVNTSYARTWSSPMELNVTDYYTMKVDGTEWSWAGDGYSYETLYFDGTNTYIDGILSEDEYNVYDYIQNIGGVEMFALYESCFVETSAGVYYAEEIAAICPDGLSPLQNITLVIVDGKIQSATYRYTFSIITSEYTEIYTAVVEHTFSNWGETIVEGISIPSHTCLFEEIVKDEFLKEEVTCTTSAIYYKSCECGEIGTDTFEHGNPLGHSYDDTYAVANADENKHYHKCTVCDTKDSGETHTPNISSATEESAKYCTVCNYVLEEQLNHVHNFIENIDLAYLKQAATCNNYAVYYKSCACGVVDTETFEDIEGGYKATAHTGTGTNIISNNNGIHEVRYTCCNAVFESVTCASQTTYPNCTVAETCICGYITKEAKSEHTYDNSCDKTCNSDGCTNTREITHTLTETAEKDADCLNAGNTAYWACSVCQKYFSDEDGTTEIEKNSWVIDALNHDEVNHSAQAATCIEIGWNEYVTCTRCDYTTYEEISAHGHNEISHNAQAATCIEIGWNEYVTCSRCDYTTYEEIPALGHDEVSHNAQAATCTDIGWNVYVTCSRCDYTTYEEIPALGHNEVNHNAQVATCTEIGWNAYVTCTRCDYTTYEEISALGHNEVNHNAQAATCTDIGWHEYVTCSRCDYTTYEEISALGHNEVSHNAQAATCTEIGWNEYVTCTRCDYTTYEEISALGHTLVIDSAILPTCTETGLTEGKHCSACNEVFVSQTVVNALGHEYVLEVVPPTCEEQGENIYTCRCGANYTTYEDAKGHTFKEKITTQPTCTTKGVKTYFCDCGYSFDISIAKAEHTYVNGICSYCNATNSTVTQEEWEAQFATWLSFGVPMSRDYTSIVAKTSTTETSMLKLDQVFDTNTKNSCFIFGNADENYALYVGDAKAGKYLYYYNTSENIYYRVLYQDYAETNASILDVYQEEETIIGYLGYAIKSYFSKAIYDAAEKKYTLSLDSVNFVIGLSGTTNSSLGITVYEAITRVYRDLCFEIEFLNAELKSVSFDGKTTLSNGVEYEVEYNIVYEAEVNFPSNYAGVNCSICNPTTSYPTVGAPDYKYDENYHWVLKSCEHPGNKISHTYLSPEIIAPTCTTEGYTKYTCFFCGYTYNTNYTEKHIFDNACDTTCNNCDYTRVTQHDFAVICSNENYHWHKCNICNYENLTDKQAHTWIAADCLSPKKCSICFKETEEALGHSWINATCTQSKTCSRCGQTEGDALGHNWCEATCTSSRTCYRCSLTQGSALGHDIEYHEAKEPTCLEIGWYEYETCTRCSYTTYQERSKLSHSRTTVVEIPASCTESGLTSYDICSRCEYCYSTPTVIPALGHQWNERICERCGCEYYTDGLKFTLWTSAEGDCYTVEKGTASDSEIYIPSIYNDLPVKIIKQSSFANYNNLNVLYIPKTIETIENKAFYGCENLEQIYFKAITMNDCQSSAGIFENAGNANNGISVEFSNDVSYIAAYLFKGAYIDQITFSSSVKSVGEGAFYVGGTYYIGFGYTIAIDTYYNGTIDEWAETNFIDSTSNPMWSEYSRLYIDNVEVVDIDLISPTKIGSYAFQGFTKATGTLTIPSSVKQIGVGAFLGCDSIVTVTIQNGVESIEYAAFQACDSLSSISIPASVVTMMDICSYCTALTTITVNSSNQRYCSVDGVLYSKDKTQLLIYPSGKTATTFTVLDTVTNISNYAFFHPIALVELKIGDGITEVDFSFNTWLEKITIGSNVTEFSFEQCSSLKEVVFVSNSRVEVIGFFAFAGCENLSTITLPASLKEIQNNAFNGCSSLKNITIPANVETIGSCAFKDCTSLQSINFDDVDGWRISDYSSGIPYETIVVTDSQKNAQYFTSDYKDKWWNKY